MFMRERKKENVNRQEQDVLLTILKEGYNNQRILAEDTGYSLGTVNQSVNMLNEKGYLNEQNQPTPQAKAIIKNKSPRNAIILAAGFGMRMVPINTEVPKGLLEVYGEPLIERIIKQLHEVGITSIYIVVGFMKEQYEYLIDEYGVELIVNTEYKQKNNLHSLRCVEQYLSNSYIIPCDIWCKNNPFSHYELYSWYMVTSDSQEASIVRVNRKMELVLNNGDIPGNTMIGISYLEGEKAQFVRESVVSLDQNHKYDNEFWERALYKKDKMIVQAKVVNSLEVIEINTYEQLREIDENSNQLRTDAIQIVSKELNVNSNCITNISVLKKGMTNRSFLFSCNGEKYIMRIPGEGTDQLINRYEEANVYEVIRGRKICDDPVYINSQNGYKITKFLNNARTCDANNVEDLRICMSKLREFHEMGLKVEHEFDLFSKIEFYESLWNGKESIYRDYQRTKEQVLSLRTFIENQNCKKTLTHIDAVPDNFLFYKKYDGTEDVQLTDWEYAGMQDPHVDIAMFCIYALYNKEQIDHLISEYFIEGCEAYVRVKIYAYIAICGLLWSNWCEYKRNLGVEFGEYSLRQYRYAKDYYKIVQEELLKLEGRKNA